MSRWYALHIKNEIIFWFLILSLVPLFFITFVNYFYQQSEYITESKKHLELILSQRVKNLDDYIYTIEREVTLLSNTPTVKRALLEYSKENRSSTDFKVYDEYFSNIIINSEYYDLFLINSRGDIVYSVKKESDLGTNLNSGLFSNSNFGKAFKNTIFSFNSVISDFDFYVPSNMDSAFVVVPIFGDSKTLGAIAIQIGNEKILNIFNSRVGLGTTGEFYGAKLDKYGNIISTTTLKNIDNSIESKYQFNKSKETPIYQATHGDNSSGVLKDYFGNSVVSAWQYIPSLRWGLVVKIDLKEILAPVDKLKFYSILIIFFIVIGIIIAIFGAIKHIVEPIEKLTVGVKNFTKGNIAQNVNIDVDNEIGELSKNFNKMALSLKESQDMIRNYANELEDKVEVRTKELKKVTFSLKESNAKMQRFIDIVDKNVITSTTDINGIITNVSQAFCNMSGYSKDELIGANHSIIRDPSFSLDIYSNIWAEIKKGNVWSGELRNMKKDGSLYWVDATISPVFNIDGTIREYTSIRQDITDKKKVEELSIRDQLTQLFNRFKLEEVFSTEIYRANRYTQPFSVIILDIDHFKSVNDTYGHNIGDDTLKDFANILKHSIRKIDIVGRWGGEEFIIIATETPLDKGMILAEKIRINIEKHTFAVIGHKTASIGVSSYKSGDTQEELVKRADDALYIAKNEGRNRVITIEK